jgi:hypothetical protein
MDSHRESANRQSKIAQIVRPWRKVKDVLAEIHSGPLGGHLGVNKTPRKGLLAPGKERCRVVVAALRHLSN